VVTRPLSGRDLADKLNRGMDQIQGWRVEMLSRPGEPPGDLDQHDIKRLRSWRVVS
jgi:hypothetical protein